MRFLGVVLFAVIVFFAFFLITGMVSASPFEWIAGYDVVRYPGAASIFTQITWQVGTSADYEEYTALYVKMGDLGFVRMDACSYIPGQIYFSPPPSFIPFYRSSGLQSYRCTFSPALDLENEISGYKTEFKGGTARSYFQQLSPGRYVARVTVNYNDRECGGSFSVLPIVSLCGDYKEFPILVDYY